MKTAPQKSTHSTTRELSPKQAAVINALASGSTITEAARQGKVDRSSIYHWLKTDALFAAELNRTRQELRDALWALLGELAVESTNFIAKLLKDENAPASLRLRASLEIIRSTAQFAPGVGETNPDKIEESRKLDEMASISLFGK